MKKILLLSCMCVFTMLACKKEDNATQYIVTPSYPTINLSGPPFYSIKVGGALPDIAGSAYDSVLHESYPLKIVGTDALDNNTPGLYVVQAKATNKYGYFSLQNIFVAVTDVSASSDLSGSYLRSGTTAVANVEKVANGLYSTDNLFGSPTLFVTAYFVHIDDTTIQMPPQATDIGDLETGSNSLHLAPGDTTYSYKILTLTSNNALRTFKKQ